MKKILYLFALLISLTISYTGIAQEQKPKVVLVLSGGGAKGLAHIPLLQALDSLHIVPDLIIGNSMGSVIGGMYAMGYSGDSIQKIAQNIDWDKVLGGNKSLKSVSAEEKSEYERYLVGIGIKDGKPTSVSSLINDQYLREFLTELTFPVYNVKDFDNLPIPFRAMATDVVYGKEVVLSKGNLAFAMRSSMSLPAIFKTMPYDKTLLVDGGVMNNFPTDVAKKMGADIIIGSDVGGGMEPIDKLDSFIAVLMQTSMFPSNIKDPDNRKLCNILVDHLPNLRFSTSDFAKSNEIYKDGKIATTLNLDALSALAAKVNKFKQREHELPKVDSEFVLDTIVYKNISKENIPLVVARTNIKTKTKYTTKELTAGINGAMGTNLFNQITYSYFVHDGDKIGLLINGLEFAKNQLNASLHYDTYRGVGLILNYNARNVLAESSRLIVTADIAEQPKLRIDFQKNFGKREEWWWKTELYGALLKQEIFVDGKSVDNMRYSSFEFNNEVNLNLNSVNSYFGFGLNYGYTVVKPKNDPDINDNVLSLKKYNYGNAEVGAHYVRNGLNKVFFATEGTLLKANVSRSFHNDISIAFTETDSTDFSGATNGFSKVGFAFEKRLPLKKTVTGIIGVNTNFIFQDKQTGREGSFSNYGYAAKYFVGGFNPSSGSNRFVFPGLHEDELSVTQFMALKVAAQLNPMGKIYITPHFDVASVGFGDFNDYIRDFSHAKGNWDEKRDSSLLMSGGAAISYQSILGPIHFDTSWINNIDKMRLFFSVGFSFNPAK